jgi:hypothetical protein
MIDERHFASLVHRTLGAALKAYGYNPAGGNAFRVRFEKPSSFVEVTYDAGRSQELSIWLGESPTDPEPPLELADVLRASECDADDIRFAELIQTSDADALERLLGRAADLLRGCASQLLADGHDAFAAARRLRSERAAEYTAELRNRTVLEAADVAWKQQDYGRVHDLLNPIRDSVGESHRRRLTFAEKRL